MTALIFGANGQDGFYLAELCRHAGVEVAGVSRSGPWVHGDVADPLVVHGLFRKYRPDYAFHLAARSTTDHSALLENHGTISTGSLNILEAARETCPGCRVFLSGSGLQFRNVGTSIRETDPFEASSAYAVARIQSVHAARYFRTLGIRAYVGYFFHHDSPRRPERHMAMKIASAAARISKGSGEVLEIGAPDATKEWGYAGDIASAAWILVNQDSVFEATLGTGQGFSVQHWADLCFQSVGLQSKDHVVAKPGYTPDFTRLVSDPRTIFSLGWKPSVDVASLSKMMVDAAGSKS